MSKGGKVERWKGGKGNGEMLKSWGAGGVGKMKRPNGGRVEMLNYLTVEKNKKSHVTSSDSETQKKFVTLSDSET